MLSKNTVLIASAGSRKTTYVVEQALEDCTRRVLILTYTIENVNQIRDYIIAKVGYIPEHILVQGWFTFLLNDCVRPYQNFVYNKRRIENIFFVEGKSAPYTKKENTEVYFLSEGNKIYTDKISEFACVCNGRSTGAVMERLTNIYDHIYVDEVQDLAGYDLELLQLLFLSPIPVTVVGDTRQATYATNYSPKNSKFKGKNIIDLFKDWEGNGLCKIEERRDCYRCNQIICDLADSLYPSMSKTISKNSEVTGHDGLFTVRICDITEYIEKYEPQVLRWSRTAETEGLKALNFGLSKGQTFPRVLVFPTNGIKHFLKKNMVDDKIGNIPKLYVAITRAKYSVAFVFDGIPANPKILPFK